MDVPEENRYESPLAAKMLTPGAAMSGCSTTDTFDLISIYCIYKYIYSVRLNMEMACTFSTAGNCALGPLDENAATLGESTPAPCIRSTGR